MLRRGEYSYFNWFGERSIPQNSRNLTKEMSLKYPCLFLPSLIPLQLQQINTKITSEWGKKKKKSQTQTCRISQQYQQQTLTTEKLLCSPYAKRFIRKFQTYRTERIISATSRPKCPEAVLLNFGCIFTLPRRPFVATNESADLTEIYPDSHFHE